MKNNKFFIGGKSIIASLEVQAAYFNWVVSEWVAIDFHTQKNITHVKMVRLHLY